MNAFITVLGFRLNFVWASSGSTPRSTYPANRLRSSAYCEQFRAMLLLGKTDTRTDLAEETTEEQPQVRS